MSGAQRRKGKAGEVESRAIFEAHGFHVVPLQAGQNGRADAGDYIARLAKDLDVQLIVDSKRREKVRVLEWSRGIEAASLGEVPVVVWRSSREPWRVTLLAEDFARLLTR